MKKSKDFRFKQFEISQQNAGMKVGTDGVLLGASAPVEGVHNILDVGTGTGLVALMLAQRSKAIITGVEIDDGAYVDACLNVKSSPWPDRMELIHSSFQQFAEECPKAFDLIVSNPPFFVNSLKAPCEKRSAARHADSLSFADLFRFSEKILTREGQIFIVFPTDQLDCVLEEAHCSGLWEKQITWIYAKPENDSKRVLLLLSREKKSNVAHKRITLHTSSTNEYTHEFVELTRDFYLNL